MQSAFYVKILLFVAVYCANTLSLRDNLISKNISFRKSSPCDKLCINISCSVFSAALQFFLRDFITLLPRAGPCSPQRSRVSCERPASSPWRPQWPRPAYQLDILPCRTSPSIKLLRKKATLPPLILILASSLLLISLAERKSAPPLLTCCSKSTSY